MTSALFNSLAPMKRRRPSSRRSRDDQPAQAKRDRKERLQGWAAVAAIAAVPTAVLIAIWQQGVFGSDSQVATRMVHLEPAGLVTYNAHDGAAPQIEITLHNTGTGLAVLESVNISVRRVAVLPQCFSAGVIPLGGAYTVQIPAKPHAGEIIQAPLHEQVAGNSADRFRLALGTPNDRTSSTINLLQLNIAIAYDHSAAPIRLGPVLIAAPRVPNPDGYFMTRQQLSRGDIESEKYIFPTTGRSLYEALAPCWRTNGLRLKEMVALKGARSSALQMATAEVIMPPMPAAGKRVPPPLG